MNRIDAGGGGSRMRRPSRERSACYKRWLRTQPNIMHVMLTSIFIYHVEDGQKLLTQSIAQTSVVTADAFDRP